MGVREYDLALGRFTSADLLKGNLTQPQQRNRYQYAGNNPLVRYDLDGNTWYEPWTWFDDEENNDSEDTSEGGSFHVDPNVSYEQSGGGGYHVSPGPFDMYFDTDDCLWWDYHFFKIGQWQIGDEQWHCHAKPPWKQSLPDFLLMGIFDFGDWLGQQNGYDEVPGHPESRHW
jgi:hypothetical protein